LDLDFVRIGLPRRVDGAMTELGFRKERQRHRTHPDTSFWVEILPGAAQVGDDVVRHFVERRTDHGTLRILTPTDSVMDRLARYCHAGDEQGLQQAVAVAVANDVDLDRIQEWSKRERALQKFERLRTGLRRGSG
jgi:hypothetical protein